MNFVVVTLFYQTAIDHVYFYEIDLRNLLYLIMPVITIQDICKYYIANTYTVKAVDHVNLSICENEAVAIAGPSGSGKSTLPNMIGLILQPDNDAVLLLAYVVTKLVYPNCTQLNLLKNPYHILHFYF